MIDNTFTLTDEYSALKERLGSDRWREIITRTRAEGRGSQMSEEADILRQELGRDADSIPRRDTPKGAKRDILSDIASLEKTLTPEECAAVRSMGGDLVGRRDTLRQVIAGRSESPAPSPATPPAAISPEWRSKLDAQIVRTQAATGSQSELHGRDKVRAVFAKQVAEARAAFNGTPAPSRATTPSPTAAAPTSPPSRSFMTTPANTPPRSPFGLAKVRAVFKKQFEAIKAGTPVQDPRIASINAKFAARKPKAPEAGELRGLARTRAAFERQFAAKRN